MGITKKLGGLGLFLFIIITVAILILNSGCTSKSEITPNETAVSVPTPTITTKPTAIPTLEIPKVAKLKIMSVTTEPATIGGIPVIMKVKNIGDATAKDVYAGAINMRHDNPTSFQNYPDQKALIYQSVQDVLINSSSNIDTGFVYSTNTSKFSVLNVYSKLDNKYYIGDILPDETKTAEFTKSIGFNPDVEFYVNMAWIDDTKEFTIY